MQIVIDRAKNRQIMVRVSEEDYQLINKMAQKEKVAQSTVTRALIEAALREYRKQPR